MRCFFDLLGGFSFLMLGMELLAGSVSAQLCPRRLDAASGYLAGLVWTAAAQSSSAVSAALVPLSAAGVLRPADCFPVLLGANLGTTGTAWLFCALHAASAQCIAILPAIAALILLRRHRTLARAGLGLSLILLGMTLMQAAAAPLQALSLSLRRADTAFWSALGLTALWQSSAATIGMVQELQGLPLSVAAAAVIGANIGTCSTALLASLYRRGSGRAIAAQQLGINLFGALLFLPLLPRLAGRAASPQTVAAFHSLFNAAAGALLLAGFGMFQTFRNRRCNYRKKMI